MAIKLHQTYRNKKNNYQIYIDGKKKGDKWLAKVLTSKPGVFNGSHSMAARTIMKDFDLVV